MEQPGDGPPAAPPPAEPPDTSLFAAIRADDVQQVERALSEGASFDGTTALEAADGFPPTGYFNGTVTALMLAVGLGRNRIASLLLKRGADVHARGCSIGATAVHIAANFGNVEMIAALAPAAGSNINTADAGGATPIWMGEQRGFASITTLPIRAFHPSCSCPPRRPINLLLRCPRQVHGTATRRRRGCWPSSARVSRRQGTAAPRQSSSQPRTATRRL